MVRDPCLPCIWSGSEPFRCNRAKEDCKNNKNYCGTDESGQPLYLDASGQQARRFDRPSIPPGKSGNDFIELVRQEKRKREHEIAFNITGCNLYDHPPTGIPHRVTEEYERLQIVNAINDATGCTHEVVPAVRSETASTVRKLLPRPDNTLTQPHTHGVPVPREPRSRTQAPSVETRLPGSFAPQSAAPQGQSFQYQPYQGSQTHADESRRKAHSEEFQAQLGAYELSRSIPSFPGSTPPPQPSRSQKPQKRKASAPAYREPGQPRPAAQFPAYPPAYPPTFPQAYAPTYAPAFPTAFSSDGGQYSQPGQILHKPAPQRQISEAALQQQGALAWKMGGMPLAREPEEYHQPAMVARTFTPPNDAYSQMARNMGGLYAANAYAQLAEIEAARKHASIGSMPSASAQSSSHRLYNAGGSGSGRPRDNSYGHDYAGGYGYAAGTQRGSGSFDTPDDPSRDRSPALSKAGRQSTDGSRSNSKDDVQAPKDARPRSRGSRQSDPEDLLLDVLRRSCSIDTETPLATASAASRSNSGSSKGSGKSYNSKNSKGGGSKQNSKG